jgi:hypothetical protein
LRDAVKARFILAAGAIAIIPKLEESPRDAGSRKRITASTGNSAEKIRRLSLDGKQKFDPSR